MRAIELDAPSSRLRYGWALAIFLSLTLVYGVIRWQTPTPPTVSLDKQPLALPWLRASRAADPTRPLTSPAFAPVGSAATAPTASQVDPDELTADEWRVLEEAIQANPDAEKPVDKHLASMAAFMRFQKGFMRWESLNSPSEQAARNQLAHQLLDQTVRMNAQGVLAFDQARQIQDVLLFDLEPDIARREALQSEQAARLPNPDQPRP